MRTLEQNDLEQGNGFSIRYRKRGDDLFVANGAADISIRDLFHTLKGRYRSRFRGAIIYSEVTFRNNLRATCDIMGKYFGRGFRLVWAVKSAPVRRLVEIAGEESVSFDVGSCEEMSLATGFAGGDRIFHTAPGKFDWDIQAIGEHDCVSISDNLTELRLLDDMAKSRNKRLSVGIRVNPAISSSTQNEIATGTLDCKFGIPEIDDGFLRALKSLSNLDIRILHMHIGSQIADPSDYENALRNLILVYRKFEAAGIRIDSLDIGGGFPFGYLRREQGLHEASRDDHLFHNHVGYSFEDYVARIHRILAVEFGDAIPRIAIEPGRHIAAGTAFALGYVLDSKQYPNGIQWAISSLSVNDLFHKMLIPYTYFDVHVLGGGTGKTVPTAIGGTLCFSGDILTPRGEAVLLNEQLQRNDILLYNNVGAYSLLGSGNFHNMPRVPILMIDADGDLVEIRGEERPYFEE